MNTDQLFHQMEEDEREDRLEEVGKATPIDYARSRYMTPQTVYYHIRKGNLEPERCACGRRVIDVKAADIFFKIKEIPEDEDRSDVPGERVPDNGR